MSTTDDTGDQPMADAENSNPALPPGGAHAVQITSRGADRSLPPAVATPDGGRLQTATGPRTLQDAVALVGPDYGERLNWVIRAPVPDPASTEPRAKSLYNRPGKEAIGYAASVLAAHSGHVTKVVLPALDRGIPPRRVRNFEQPASIEGRAPFAIGIGDHTGVGTQDARIAHVRAMTPCGLTRLINAKGSRRPRKFGILVNSGSTSKDTYEKWDAGLKGQQLDLMHSTSLASNLWSLLPLKPNEIALMSDHVIWADDFLQPMAASGHVPVHFVVASAAKLKPEDSTRVTMPDGTTRMEYVSNMEMLKMKSKMESVLNVAASDNMTDVVLGPFGYGAPYNHPVDEIARLWTQIILEDHAKWRFYGMRFHFALPLGHGCPDEVWKAFEKAMATHAAVSFDHDSSSSWSTCKIICSS